MLLVRRDHGVVPLVKLADFGLSHAVRASMSSYRGYLCWFVWDSFCAQTFLHQKHGRAHLRALCCT